MKWTKDKRRRESVVRRRICLEIEAAGKPYDPTVARIAEQYKGQRGFSKVNIRTFFDRWQKRGKHDEELEPYRTSYLDKTVILQKHGLTTDEISHWLELRRMTISQWATENGFLPSTVSLAIRGKRAGWKCQEIMDCLAFDIRNDVPASILEELKALRAQEDDIRSRRLQLETRIAKARRKIPN